jgi:hypothetical protein
MYLDEEADRVKAHVQGDFDALVEAVRAGTIFAHDGKQHARWRGATDRRAGRKRTGKQLRDLARDFGGQVTVGGFEFRN